jgi:hypothetical protein
MTFFLIGEPFSRRSHRISRLNIGVCAKQLTGP